MKRTVLLTMVTVLSFLLLFSASQVIAQDFCEGNFDYDPDVDGTDASVFKENFGRSAFKNPCPPDGPSPVPKTGQTTAYANGDDGARETGVAWPNPRFTDNGDGTVTDNLTGLIWMRDANWFLARTWAQALDDCQLLTDGSGGLTDGSIVGTWRLPSIKELLSLIDYGNDNPSLPEGNPFFNMTGSFNYWSSTTFSASTGRALSMSIDFGEVESRDKAEFSWLWCVRGGH